MAALLLLVLRHNQMISSFGAAICFAAWVLKDWILYPWLRSAYEVSYRTGSKALIGCKGVCESHLVPEGFVRVRGELWRAAATPGDLQISIGTKVEIVDADRMKVFVRPVSDDF
jgi:membrane protein implicated in regulation of membrane protease activity